jgi:hypothetical protein
MMGYDNVVEHTCRVLRGPSALRKALYTHGGGLAGHVDDEL